MAIKKSSMFTQAPFANVPGPDLPRSTFDRSKKYATSLDPDYLVPVFMEEVYPGDVSEMRSSFFLRFFSALKLPNFDNLYLETFWFYIRTRLVFDKFAQFNGFQENPGDSTDYTIPQLPVPTRGFAPGQLYNYFGWPTLDAGQSDFVDKTTSALPGRCYRLTFNEWFRNQNYVDSLEFEMDETPDIAAVGTYVAKRMKRPDRFTSVLPAPQKGPDVRLPISNSVDVYGRQGSSILDLWNNPSNTHIGTRKMFSHPSNTGLIYDGAAAGHSAYVGFATKENLATLGVPSSLYADLAEATMANVNNIRLLFQIQKVYEKDMRGGTRATEYYRVHWGVVIPDYTIQRPELLQTTSNRIQINPVAQTSQSDETPQGTLTGIGYMPPEGGGSFIKTFDEHGFLMCLVNVRADVTYSQGIDPMFSRKTRFDYYLPTFAHLGETLVPQREIFVNNDNIDDVSSNPLGYNERWYDLRFPYNNYTGLFQPQVSGNLAAYHLGLHFTSPINVDSNYMESATPISRIVSVTNQHAFLLQSFYNHKKTMSLPMFSVPGLVDHF